MKEFFEHNQEHELRRLMKQHEFGPVPGAWEALESQLKQAEHRRKRPWLWYWLGTTSLVLGLGWGLWQFQNNHQPQPTTNDTIREQVQTPPPKKSTAPNLAEQISKPKAETKTTKPQNPSYRTETSTTSTSLQTAQEPKQLTALSTNHENPPLNQQETQAKLNPANLNLEAWPKTQPPTDPQIAAFELAPKKRSPWQFGLSLGLSLAQHRDKNHYSSSPSFGVFAKRHLQSRSSLSAQLQYRQINWRDQPSPFSRQEGGEHAQIPVSEPQFVEDDKYTRLYFPLKSIDLIELQLEYDHQLNQHWSWQGGLRTALLINADSKDPERKYSVNHQGLSSWDWGIHTGLSYHFNENWSLGLQLGLGLRNLSRPSPQHRELPENLLLAYADQLPEWRNEKEGYHDIPVYQAEDHQTFVRLPKHIYSHDTQIRLRYAF